MPRELQPFCPVCGFYVKRAYIRQAKGNRKSVELKTIGWYCIYCRVLREEKEVIFDFTRTKKHTLEEKE